MFDFKQWTETFKSQPGYNDAVAYGVTIDGAERPTWIVLGVHHLTPEENRGNHNIYIEVLDKHGNRDPQRPVHWTWQGRRTHEPAHPIRATKPPHEVVDLALHSGMVVDLWIQGGQRVRRLHATHPDEGNKGGNTIGHHSFYVCFQEVDTSQPRPPAPDPPRPDPPPPDPPPPTPPPPTPPLRMTAQKMEVTIKRISISKAYLDRLPVDDDGNVTLDIAIESVSGE